MRLFTALRGYWSSTLSEHFGASAPSYRWKARSPVVFAYNGGIGDRICNLPALRALDSLFPDGHTLVCSKGDRPLYYADLKLRAVHELEFETSDQGWAFDVRPLALSIAECDLFLCINPWHTESVSELLTHLPDADTIGFFPAFRHPLSCDYEGHAMDMAFAIPAYLNNRLKITNFSRPLSISLRAVATAQEFKRRHAVSQRILFVHPETKPEKSWPLDRFTSVLGRFVRDFPDFTVLVVGLREDYPERGVLPERIVRLDLPLDVCFALLREADLFLGIDSCFLHAADLFRVPGVGLFGPTTCRRWGFKFSNHWHIQSSGHMDMIEIDDVSRALSSLAMASYHRTDSLLRLAK